MVGNRGTVLGRHDGWVTRIAVAAAGGQVLTCSSDGSARAWLSPSRVLLATQTWANDLAIAPDGAAAAIAYEDGTSAHCPLAPDREPDREMGREDEMDREERPVAVTDAARAWASAIAFAGDGGRIACGDAAGVIRVWDADRRQVIHALDAHAGAVTALARMADGSVLSGGADGRILRWDFDGGGLAGARVDCHADCVSGLAIHPAGRHAVSAGHDGEIRAWSLPGGRPLGVFAAHGWKCMSAVFTPDGQRVVSAGTDGRVRVWEWPTGRAVAVLAGHENPVNWVGITGDGQSVLSASEDATIRAWNLRTGDEAQCWRGHQQGIRCVAVTPRGDRLVSTSVDGTVRIWDRGGRQLFCHDVHGDWVNGVAVTRGGGYALSASDSPAAQLVLTSIDTGEPALRWHGHSAPAFAVACVSVGGHAVTTGLDGRARVWDISGVPAGPPPLVCEFTAGEELYACTASRAGDVVIVGTGSGRVHTLIPHEGSDDDD